MKAVFRKMKSLPVLVGTGILLLQSCILMHGCSNSTAGPITEERRLYSSKCGSCHRLLPPEDHTVDEWRHYVDKYGKKMTPQEKQVVLTYLEQRAK